MSRLGSLAARVAGNWRLKLASLALAVLLWALVRAEQRTEQWVTVRVEPHVLDPSFILTGRSDPRTVQVRFAGRWRELGELAIERPTLVLYVRNVGRQRVFTVEPSMVRLPDDVRGSVVALDVRPDVVRLPLERITERPAPARPTSRPERLPDVAPRTEPVGAADTALASDTTVRADTAQRP